MSYEEKMKELKKLEDDFDELTILHHETLEELKRVRRYDYEIALIICKMEEKYLLNEKSRLEEKLRTL